MDTLARSQGRSTSFIIVLILTIVTSDPPSLPWSASRLRAEPAPPAAPAIAGFVDITRTGLTSVEYLDLDLSHPPALAGVDWGGRFFGGSFDTGCRWSRTRIAGEEADYQAGLCPGSQFIPRRFGTVELRFDGRQEAYRYLRRDVPHPDGTPGEAPASGRGYVHAGVARLPFTAWKLVGGSEVQLQVMVTERLVTDPAGIPLPIQPSSQDSSWMPTAAPDGAYELLSILDMKYSDPPDTLLTADGAFINGVSPVLFGGWLRLSAPGAIIDPGDRFIVNWLDLADQKSQGSGIYAAWGDIDRDGDLDFYVANRGGSDNRLYRNEGGGDLRELFANPLSHSGRTAAAAWVDIDNDHDIDLAVLDAITPSPARLFRNDGNERFVDIAAGPLSTPGYVSDMAWADFDLDGDLDVFMASGIGLNHLLWNDGGGRFSDRTPALLADNPRFLQHAVAADYDGDADPDLLPLGQNL